MKLTSGFKRIFAVILAMLMVIAAVPVNVMAASDSRVVDAAIIFTDLHTNKSNYKQSTVTGIFGALKNTGLPFSAVFSGGDAFSVNEDSGKYTGYTSTITGYIRNALGNNSIPVEYVWSDHDRYAMREDGSTLLDKSSRLVYGAGSDGIYGTDDDGNYYVYMLSMGDLSTNDRYKAGFSSNRASNGFTATVSEAINNFKADAAKLNKDRPLLIVSHQPLLDNRNDNGYAYDWCTAINAVALEMDVAFFFGHNHKYDKSTDYYYAKGSTMAVCKDSSGNSTNVKLNFDHICGGYMEPTSTGSYSSSGTRRNVVMAVVIYEDAIRYTTYTDSGIYTGSYALDVTVTREHAAAGGSTTPEEPDVPVVPEEPDEPDVPVDPDEPDASGKIWRKATTITNGKKYMLVNYGFNDSGVKTYAVDKNAAPAEITVKTDADGAYIVSDDMSLAWIAKSVSSQFEMANAETGYFLRAANYVYGSSGSDISVNQSTNNGSTYTNWSLETKNGSQVLSVRRGGSGNYYPVRYNGTKFQAFNSSQVGSMNNWLAVFVETEENAHQHNFVTVTVEATCVKEGSVTASCTCGEKTVEVIPALGHDYKCVTTEATCGKAGSKVYTCTVCADSYTETIPATGKHTYTSVKVDATCTTAGKITYTCDCGDTYTETIPALGHDYTAEVTAPTCSAEGYTAYTCSCGHTYTEVIPATGEHTYTSVKVDATCTTAGKITYTCTCGDTYTETIPALGHDYTAKVTVPTCTAEGYTTYTCSCGDTYTADKVPALGHKYTTETIAPTCSEEGSVIYTCICGDTYTEVIPATGKHVYTAVQEDAACTEEGKITYTCDCGDTYTETIPVLGHDYTAKVTAPTCTAEGYTTYTCACGDTYTADQVPALGHDYTAKVTVPTCTAEGYTTYTCACGDTYTADQVPALGHDYTAKVTAPTCTAEGYTTYTCACGDTYTAEKVPALGHDYTAKVTAPTCTEAGYTTYTCAECGHSYIGNQTAATGHSYTAKEENGYMVYTCRCGHSYSEKLEVNLSYVKVSSLTADNYVITFTSGRSSYALTHKNNTIGVVKVTVSNNQITSEVTDDMIWTYSGGKLSYKSGSTTYSLYAKSSGSWWGWGSTPTLTISSSDSTSVSLKSGKLKLGDYYLRYSYNSVSLNRSGTAAGLYQETEN